MKLIEVFTDSYDRKARLYPALLLISPIIALVVAAVSANYSVLQAVAAGVAACGGAFFLTQIARDAGKKVELRLFEKWNGLPSVAIFRHRDDRFDSITKARYHRAVASLVKGAKAPTPEEEHENPGNADEVYTAWSNYLRTHTRDQKRFTLLFKENINYGYRRNILGLRQAGILISATSCVIAAFLLWRVHQQTDAVDQRILGAGVFSLAMLLLWTFRFSPDWVRVPADAYAYRLIETIDTLPAAQSPTKH